MKSLSNRIIYYIQNNTIDIISFIILFNSAFFPTFIFNKIALISIISIVLFLAIYNSNLKFKFTFGHKAIYLIFFYAFFLAFFLNTITSHSFQLLFCTSLLLLVTINPIAKINFDLHIRLIGILISFYTISLLIYFLFGNIDLDIRSNSLASKLWETSFMSIGYREFGDLTLFQFQIGSAPILFISLGLWIKRLFTKININNIFGVVLVTITLLVSGQRALILATFLAYLLGFFFFTKFKNKFYVGLFLVILLVSLFMPFLVSQLFFEGDKSTEVKIRHIQYFLGQLTIPKLIFGSGLGSEFYSGYRIYMAITENTFLDLIRFLGLPLAILSYISLLFPQIKNIRFYFKLSPFEFYLMVIYLLISLTNPVLLNSYGIYVICWYWNHVINYQKQNYVKY